MVTQVDRDESGHGRVVPQTYIMVSDNKETKHTGQVDDSAEARNKM